jgi:hypothetical protein
MTMPSSSKHHRHPSVGVHDTLKRHFTSTLAKVNNKRRKLFSMTHQHALQRYAVLKSATAMNSYSQPRSDVLTLTATTTTKTTIRKETENDSNSPTTFNRPSLGMEKNITEEQSPKDGKMKENQNKDRVKSILSDEIITPTIVDLAQNDNRYYEQQATILELAMVQIDSAKQRVQRDQVALWGVYTYGLQHVMGLNDLASSPDAILPGNFETTDSRR